MNNAINYRNFIDMLIKSDDDYESYGFERYSLAPVPIHTQAGYTVPRSLDGPEESHTWYGE